MTKTQNIQKHQPQDMIWVSDLDLDFWVLYFPVFFLVWGWGLGNVMLTDRVFAVGGS